MTESPRPGDPPAASSEPDAEAVAQVRLRPLALPPGVPGRVWLSAMPGRDDSWPAFLSAARRARIDRLVCLTPLFELSGNSPAYLAEVQSGSLPFAWDHLPMRDFGVALQTEAFEERVPRTAERLREGESVLVHCAAGIGRTGTFAACVLKALGATKDDALSTVRAAGSNPQSAAQSGLIDRF